MATGRSFFDVWSLIHLAVWFVVGGNLEALDLSHWIRWPAILAGAILWEVAERLWFRRWVKYQESWLNSWVSDILMAFVGAGAGMLLISYQ